MDPQTHPDPFHDAMNHALQRAVQVASSVVTGAQVLVYLKRSQARTLAERDERARRALAAHHRAEGAAARAGWAPALDRDWARDADLARAAQAWGAAMPYADPAAPWHEPAAATAMRRCEERLRVLHPQAMARYDRLRDEGQEPADAMREAAPLFGYPPDARDAPYAPRLALTIGDAGKPDRTAARPGPGPAGGDLRADPASTARAGKTQAGSSQAGASGGTRSLIAGLNARRVHGNMTSRCPSATSSPQQARRRQAATPASEHRCPCCPGVLLASPVTDHDCQSAASWPVSSGAVVTRRLAEARGGFGNQASHLVGHPVGRTISWAFMSARRGSTATRCRAAGCRATWPAAGSARTSSSAGESGTRPPGGTRLPVTSGPVAMRTR